MQVNTEWDFISASSRVLLSLLSCSVLTHTKNTRIQTNDVFAINIHLEGVQYNVQIKQKSSFNLENEANDIISSLNDFQKKYKYLQWSWINKFKNKQNKSPTTTTVTREGESERWENYKGRVRDREGKSGGSDFSTTVVDSATQAVNSRCCRKAHTDVSSVSLFQSLSHHNCTQWNTTAYIKYPVLVLLYRKTYLQKKYVAWLIFLLLF